MPTSARTLRVFLVCALVAAGLTATPQQATAQLAAAAAVQNVVPSAVRGTDSAFDPVNDVHLVVGAYGPLWGVFVNSAGVAVTAPFVISGNSNAPFAHFPRVTYSEHLSNGAGGLGGFLVAWHQNSGNSNFVNTRIISFNASGHMVGAQLTLPGSATFWEAAPAVAYSSTSQRFLVAWQTCCGGSSVIQAALLGTSNQLVAGPFQISGGYGRDPGVAWNSATDEFGVSFNGEDTTSIMSAFARVSTAGTVLRRNVFNRSSSGTFISDVVYNPTTNRFVSTWFQNSGRVHTAEFDATGEALAAGIATSQTGTYDGLGIAYSAASGTILLVGHHSSSEVAAVELNGRGARISAEATVVTSSGALGAYYPRPSASGNTRAHWNVTFSRRFTAVLNQKVSTVTTGGGGSTAAGAAPASSGGSGSSSSGSSSSGSSGSGSSGSTSPTSCPGNAPVADWVCVNGGWLPPSHPSAAGATSSGSSSSGSSSSGSGSSGSSGTVATCSSNSPVSGWVCVNGGWVPPSHPLASQAGSSSGSSGGSSSGGSSGSTGTSGSGATSCSGNAPVSGWVCVNGGWVPPNHPLAGGGRTPESED